MSSDYPKNIDEPTIDVKLAGLTQLSPDKHSWVCPVCVDGTLVMRRHPETLELLANDNCLLCGQSFHYVDIEAFKRHLEGNK